MRNDNPKRLYKNFEVQRKRTFLKYEKKIRGKIIMWKINAA
jgi:hypothetical protein